MAERIEIGRDSPLQTLRVTWDAPLLLTPASATDPIEDVARLYRMSTGIYGRGYPGMMRPFPYAKPYVSQLHFGSDLYVEVIVPTTFIVGVAGLGLPNLLELLKQALMAPLTVPAAIERARRARSVAKIERIGAEAVLRAPEEIEREALANQRAKTAEAERRELEARAATARMLDAMDRELIEIVRRSSGNRAVYALIDIAERAERGPARPRDIDVRPVEDPGKYPDPPQSSGH